VSRVAMATNSQNKVHNLDLDMNGANQMSEWEPNIVSFLCNWCSYGAADLAGVSRMQYPANIRVVRIPCTGRMSPKFALAALRQGADGVWVSG
jgi:F420-non-reducing hydrogenase iron-sulfur subunit